MSARDKFHGLVKHDLENEGWTITHHPYTIDLGFVDFYRDLGAERLLAAIKDDEKIAVEIKTLLAASAISEFPTVLDNSCRFTHSIKASFSQNVGFLTRLSVQIALSSFQVYGSLLVAVLRGTFPVSKLISWILSLTSSSGN